MKKRIYLAGGLFNAGERMHNLYLEQALKAFGYEVILPQREALKFFVDGVFNLPSMVEDCAQFSADPDIYFVGNLDGPDADSGTSVEYGIAMRSKGKSVMYRTDFRTAMEREVGINGMFHLKTTTIIYEPCLFTELDEVDTYYRNLAQKIHEAITSLNSN